jgi:hypothetical protein
MSFRFLLALMVVLPSTSQGAMAQPDKVPERRLRTLSWTGTAKVFPERQAIELGISTVVEPFKSARTDSWLLAKGRSTLRSIIVEPTGGWMEIGGRRQEMPAAMLAQERQQYGIYGQIQLAMLAHQRSGRRTIRIGGDGNHSVDTEFKFERGHLSAARNSVTGSEQPGTRIEQRFRFSGEVRSNGLVWPRHLEIDRGGARYFVLDIATFSAR